MKNQPGLLIPCLVLMLCLLAACGTNTGGTTSSPTPTTSATQPPLQHCGAVRTLGIRIVPTNEQGAKSATDCFWQAYQQCHPATLTYTQAGVDTATVHTFSLKKINGKCVVIDTIQHLIVPNRSMPGETAICSGLSQQTDGLHVLACGKEGEVLVPVITGK